MKKLLLLLLTIGSVTTNAQLPGQPPFIPPLLPTPLGVTNRVKRVAKFTTLCPHCRIKFQGLTPLTAITNGAAATNGGTVIDRTLTFLCPKADCHEVFSSKNSLFVPESIAVEEPVVPPVQLPGAPAPGASIQSWTTNSNLRLAVELLNKGSNLTLLGVTNGSTIYGTVALFIGPTPMVAIRFPTEVGKFYKYQATDDAKKTWIDGPVVAGTGQSVTNYELPVKPSRLYRVVEL